MTSGATVTFLITTARSGTQWLASALEGTYPDRLRVEHEPIGYRYRPVANLRDPGALRRLLDEPEVSAHFRTIDETVSQGTSYVELGFPTFALYPLLRDRFADRVRILHLTRHPARVAASLVTHRWYTQPGRPDLRGTVELTPSSSGVLLRDYADRWSSMTAYEKSLFLWFEVHAYGLEVERRSPADECIRVRFEDLVGRQSERERLLAFLGLSDREAFHRWSDQTIDIYRHRTPEHVDVSLIEAHPRISALGRELRYDLRDVTQAAMDARYRERATDRWRRQLGRVGRRAWRMVR